MPNDFTVKMILTLFDENDNKASVYDAFEIALIPDGMDDLFSLKVKSGYYFKYTAEYDFPYLDFSQTFDEWGYDSQDVTVKESLALDPITQNFNDALTTVLASVPWSVPNSPNPIRPIYDTSFSSE
jgi:hypothetical protein